MILVKECYIKILSIGAWEQDTINSSLKQCWYKSHVGKIIAVVPSYYQLDEGCVGYKPTVRDKKGFWIHDDLFIFLEDCVIVNRYKKPVKIIRRVRTL